MAMALAMALAMAMALAGAMAMAMAIAMALVMAMAMALVMALAGAMTMAMALAMAMAMALAMAMAMAMAMALAMAQFAQPLVVHKIKIQKMSLLSQQDRELAIEALECKIQNIQSNKNPSESTFSYYTLLNWIRLEYTKHKE
jgi:hypothetical protein